MLTYLLAVLAACMNATSSVLQRKANRRVPQKQNLSVKLIVSLFHQPVWFGGVLAVIAGFLLQATALGMGQLTVVEPILVLELPATLILGSRVFGTRLGRREWGATAAMTAGLAGLLYFLSPSAGRPAAVPWYVWLTGVGINLALIGALVAWARRRPGGRSGRSGRGGRGGRGGNRKGGSPFRAAVLGTAAGSAFGLTAALMKAMTNTFSQGIGVLFTSWPLYTMIASGVLGMFLLQSAMNAGRLIAAQPGITLSDPIVSILWGLLVFQEKARGGWFIALAVVSGLVMAAAVISLGKSPQLSGGPEPAGEGPRAGARAGDEPDSGATQGRPRHHDGSRSQRSRAAKEVSQGNTEIGPRFVATAIASEQAIDDATDGAPDGMTRPQSGNQSHVS